MPSTVFLSDERLMQQVAIGDSGAFEELYRRHARTAMAVARRGGAPPELAEEVVQDAFLALWRRAPQYHAGRGSVDTWIAAIVRNRLTDAWRRAGARPSQVPEDALGEPAAPADLPPEDRLVVRAGLAGLPREQREALVLSYFGGLTHEQIAAGSGDPLGTVKGRLRLGLDKLRLSFAA
mgnify:CR=1 FL=1